MNKISVARFIVKKLESWKIKDVPIFQGGAIMNVLSEIGKSKKIKYYCPYHEQALAMAVDAYSRLNGLGVGFVTSGPGATNLLTGVACSYYDSVPAIFFSGQVGQFHITGDRKVRQRGFQESDIVSIFRPVTKFSYQVKNAEEIEFILEKAKHIATSGRPGPVLIDLPFNIQKRLINPKYLRKFKAEIKKKNEDKKIRSIEKLINKAKKPLLIAGGGIRIADQIKKFRNLIDKKNLPFITTWPAQDITNSNNRLYFGSVGRHANLSASNLAKKSDLIITFGVRFSPKIATKYFGQNAKIISIDIDRNELNQGLVNPNLKLNLDLKEFFKKFKLNKVNKFNNENWINECIYQKKKYFKNFDEMKNSNKNKFVNPYSFVDALSERSPDNAILLTDAGCNLTYFMQAFKSKNKQRIISAWGNSPMGYSVAAGIGAKIAQKNKLVISCIGDGSFLMNLQELQFLKENDTKLKIIVFDNKIYGNTKIGCEVYKIKNVGNDASSGYFPPNVKEISKSFNIKYFYLKSNKSQNEILKKFLKINGNGILHINIHPDHPLIEHQNI
tara:strand:+ start:1113 stop:2783 length:1671 start_codon:yes stop_codon:yes gene_type:complete